MLVAGTLLFVDPDLTGVREARVRVGRLGSIREAGQYLRTLVTRPLTSEDMAYESPA